jgi:hypothetical protein
LNRSGDRSRYHVYVLRLWCEPDDSAAPLALWRFVLDEPQTSQQRGFADFGALVTFLEGELQRPAPPEN